MATFQPFVLIKLYLGYKTDAQPINIIAHIKYFSRCRPTHSCIPEMNNNFYEIDFFHQNRFEKWVMVLISCLGRQVKR